MIALFKIPSLWHQIGLMRQIDARISSEKSDGGDFFKKGENLSEHSKTSCLYNTIYARMNQIKGTC